jgi:hypothetical protein
MDTTVDVWRIRTSPDDTARKKAFDGHLTRLPTGIAKSEGDRTDNRSTTRPSLVRSEGSRVTCDAMQYAELSRVVYLMAQEPYHLGRGLRVDTPGLQDLSQTPAAVVEAIHDLRERHRRTCTKGTFASPTWIPTILLTHGVEFGAASDPNLTDR